MEFITTSFKKPGATKIARFFYNWLLPSAKKSQDFL